MKKIIIIKYGELSTKKDNINFFLNTLKKNILLKLKKYNIDIKFDRGRMFIIPENNFDKIVSELKLIFGIHEINIAYELESIDIDEIGNNILELIKDKEFNTFKVVTKRSNKSISKTSMEISAYLGGIILKNKKVTVDIHNPELIINIELRLNKSYIYFEKEIGLGGYPVSSLGKGLLMLSGGIDSPVSGYLTIKRGVKLEAIYFESPPHTSVDAKNKVLALAKILSKYNNEEVKIHVINFTEIQESIYKNIPHDYLITIMRRMMYRISSIIASRENCKVLVNGESIGQVASQTLTSMSVINEVIKTPVIRPVACFDKNEIINISKNIGTYETSILPYEDCCTIFVPDHPVINPLKEKCVEYEELIPYNDLIYNAIKNHEVIKVLNEEKKFTSIL